MLFKTCERTVGASCTKIELNGNDWFHNSANYVYMLLDDTLSCCMHDKHHIIISQLFHGSISISLRTYQCVELFLQ